MLHARSHHVFGFLFFVYTQFTILMYFEKHHMLDVSHHITSNNVQRYRNVSLGPVSHPSNTSTRRSRPAYPNKTSKKSNTNIYTSRGGAGMGTYAAYVFQIPPYDPKQKTIKTTAATHTRAEWFWVDGCRHIPKPVTDWYVNFIVINNLRTAEGVALGHYKLTT